MIAGLLDNSRFKIAQDNKASILQAEPAIIDNQDKDYKRPFSEPTIIIGRHGKPKLSRKVFLNSKGYREWWKKYDEGTIVQHKKPPRKLLNAVSRSNVIIASPLPRAYDTAKAVAGNREIIVDDIFVEAPLPPPPLPDFIKFRPKTWGFLARLCWHIGFHAEMESRHEAEIRAKTAALKLIHIANSDGSVAVLAHGWFNRMMRPFLKEQGWVCIYDGGDWHWSYRVYRRV